MAIDPTPRSAARLQAMAGAELRKGERVVQAAPMCLGGAYVPFLGTIVLAVAIASAAASVVDLNRLVVVAGGAALGAFAGRQLAMRATRNLPIDARALQVYLGVTDRRVIVFEPRSWGKPARLLASFPASQVGQVQFVKGNFIRPSRLSFLTSTGEHRYEFSGLWDVSSLLDSLG
jgi:hypothetical protein